MNRLALAAATLLLAALPGTAPLASGHGAAAHPATAHAAPAPQAPGAGPCAVTAEPAAAPEAPTAASVLRDLSRGNARYVKGFQVSKPLGDLRRGELAKGQHPKAVILGCSDSRVPPEHVFDQGLGDLFVVRLAGNVADPAAIGSIEYAAEHLGTPVVMVLGHRSCGAVKATVDGAAVEGNLGAVVKEIQPAVKAARKRQPGPGLLDASVEENARLQAAALLERSPVLRHLVREGKLKVAVGLYDLVTGKVDVEELPARPVSASLH